MKRKGQLRALWSSTLQGVYLAVLTVALVAFGMHVGQGVARIYSGRTTPADEITALVAWLCGEHP